MKYATTPQWIKKYQRKATTGRFFGLCLLIIGLSNFISLTQIKGSFTTFQAMLLTSSLFLSYAFIIMGFSMLVTMRVKHRKFEGYYICHYVGWKNHLIIDDEECDSSFFGKCFASLNDGKEIESGGIFGISFRIYDPTTGRSLKL